MSFGVRGTGGGESVCKGTGQTHFVREPVEVVPVFKNTWDDINVRHKNVSRSVVDTM